MSVITTCSILTGDAPIRVEWYKDSLPLDVASLNIHRNEMGDLGSSLVFRSVGPSHAGNYTCFARNRAGEDSFTAQMIVRGMHRICYSNSHISFNQSVSEPRISLHLSVCSCLFFSIYILQIRDSFFTRPIHSFISTLSLSSKLRLSLSLPLLFPFQTYALLPAKR